MKIEITLNSSMEDSKVKLIIQNVEEGVGEETLLTIESPSGTEDIYVLTKDLRDALNKLI